MALSQRLQVRQVQSLVMTPQLQQAIKLLQMSNLELSAYVEEQLVENPMLEARESEGDVAGSADDPSAIEPAQPDGDAAEVMAGEAGFGSQLEASDTDYSNVWDDGRVGGGEAGGEEEGGGGAEGCEEDA